MAQNPLRAGTQDDGALLIDIGVIRFNSRWRYQNFPPISRISHCTLFRLGGLMIRSIFAFMLMAAFSCAATARADETERLIFVPAGTPVKVHLVGTLSSKDARDDQTFPIAAAEDVIIDGMVVIPKGAGGEGVVKKVDGARGSGHSGSLQLVMNYVHSADGGKIALTASVQNQSEEDRKGASSTATIIGVATFGLGGLFAHNLARGREEVLDDKKIMNVFTDSNVHVQTSMKPQQPDASYDK